MIGDRDAMRPEALLLDHFAALAAAPGGVAALRQLILQLAVQGRLVPQDPADELVGVLLERIAAEKRRLVRESPTVRMKNYGRDCSKTSKNGDSPGFNWSSLMGIPASRRRRKPPSSAHPGRCVRCIAPGPS